MSKKTKAAVDALTSAKLKAGQFVKFTLPPNVELEGLYHLGNGVFVGQLDPVIVASMPDAEVDQKVRLAMPSKYFLQAVPAEEADRTPTRLAFELIDNPMPSKSPADTLLVRVNAELAVSVPEPETGMLVLRSCKTGEPMPSNLPRGVLQ